LGKKDKGKKVLKTTTWKVSTRQKQTDNPGRDKTSSQEKGNVKRKEKGKKNRSGKTKTKELGKKEKSGGG